MMVPSMWWKMAKQKDVRWLPYHVLVVVVIPGRAMPMLEERNLE